MNSTATEHWTVGAGEREILTELLQAERAKLLVEIRHTHHRAFRNDLRARLASIEKLLENFQSQNVSTFVG